MTRPELIKILERTQTGEYCTVNERDTRRIPEAIRNKLKQYRLEKTFSPENPVNTHYQNIERRVEACYRNFPQ